MVKTSSDKTNILNIVRLVTKIIIGTIQSIANTHNLGHSGESPCQKNNMTLHIMVFSWVNEVNMVNKVNVTSNSPIHIGQGDDEAHKAMSADQNHEGEIKHLYRYRHPYIANVLNIRHSGESPSQK